MSITKSTSVKKELHPISDTDAGTEVQPDNVSNEVSLLKQETSKQFGTEKISNSNSYVALKSYHDEKSAIVPRKGVVDKKGIVGRKGVTQVNTETSLSENDLRGISEPTSTLATTPISLNVSVSTTSTDDITTPKSPTTTASAFIVRGSVNDFPVPPVKQVTTKKSLHASRLQPKPVTDQTPAQTVSGQVTEAAAAAAVRHSKPSAAVDSVSNKTFNSTPIIVGIAFGIVVILAVAILAYKKLEDVWSRRHYDRMDFLIDGMYDL